MNSSLTVPSVTANPEELADWLELAALGAADRNSSLEDLVGALRRSGTSDALDLPDAADGDGSENTRIAAEDALGECDDRRTATGTGYPFRVERRYIAARASSSSSTYAFLLLLSKFGLKAGPSDASPLFEDVCEAAVREYFGGAERGVRTYQFGFPRRVKPAGFQAALDDMCVQMGEGGGSKAAPKRKDQKDGRLDLVAWQSFTDAREGKLIAFGQCATGGNWLTKTTELQPDAFCELWMLDMVPVKPIRMFLIPFRLDRKRWMETSRYAGIVFDRCRLASLAARLSRGLRDRLKEWTVDVIASKLRT